MPLLCAACDVPSHLYCYSFEPNPDWSRSYAPQEEIQDYIRRCVDKYNLRPHIRFNTEIISARYNEKMALWEVRDATGMMARVHIVISAKGALQIPSLPAIPGIDTFRGDAFHSAQWQHDVDLTGKEVAVIGTTTKALVKNWFGGAANQIEEIRAGDGKVLLNTEVQNLVSAMAAFSTRPAGSTMLTGPEQAVLTGVLAANWS